MPKKCDKHAITVTVEKNPNKTNNRPAVAMRSISWITSPVAQQHFIKRSGSTWFIVWLTSWIMTKKDLTIQNRKLDYM